MVAIAFRFLSGRYHATPWGRHVNEGITEWPPSPWRLLRALAATWLQRAPDLPRPEVEELLNRLALPPVFCLPDSREGHTRHYMPTRNPSSPNLVFDTFQVIPREQPVWVGWPGIDLSQRQKEILALLLARMGYLGRAESWTEARLADDMPEPNCVPEDGAAAMGEDVGITVRVMVASRPLDLDKLIVETGDLRKARLLVPPGSQWVRYRLPRFKRKVATRERQDLVVPGIATVTVARFLLHGKVLPPVTEILSLGDAARRAAMSWFGRLNGKRPSPVLSGKDTTGSPLQGHRHAFYLPTDEDKDGYLDHLTIWVKDGLPRAEVEALASVPAVQWGRAEDSTVRLTLLGFADEELAERMAPALFARSRRWVSFSPFVLVRHSKLRKQSMPGGQGVQVVDGPIDQLRRELRNHGFEGSDVEVRERQPVRGHWAEFRRRRRTGPPPAGGGYGFELTFPSAVKGPIALGYGCHFGLGLFLAVP